MPPRLGQQESSSSSDSSYSSDEDHFHNPLGTVTEVNEDDYDSDGELRPKPLVSRQIHPSRKGGGTKDQFVESSAVLILLVDPHSKRFELLQFQQNNHKKNIKIKAVLQQLKQTITEPELKKLSLIGLMDRTCQTYKPNAFLQEARQYPKDILVGLSRGVQTNELLQSVRPILGDPKMGKLLDMNGFDTKGWVKKKKTKDSILDNKKKRKPGLVQQENQGSFLTILAFTLLVAGILVCMDKLLVHLDTKGAFVQPLIEWPIVMEQAGDFAKQGIEAAKEAMEGNSTALVAIANSTYAAVEETALEAVSDTKAIVEELGWTNMTTQMVLESAQDYVLKAAVPVAEKVSEAKVNLTSSIVAKTESIANLTESIANVTETIIADSQKAITTVPNSIWEDYVLIGLLVCWLLYWMAI